jgi:hypothetical protein
MAIHSHKVSQYLPACKAADTHAFSDGVGLFDLVVAAVICP